MKLYDDADRALTAAAWVLIGLTAFYFGLHLVASLL